MWRGFLNLLRARSVPGRVRVRQVLQARYDAAATTEDNRRHWANSDGLSAAAANSPEVRRILRNRARYEIANNSYAKGLVINLANDVVGTGPRLQMLTNDAELNRQVEQAFMDWSGAINLPEKLRTMRMARASDGEAFGILIQNPLLPTPVKLDLRLVEADQVTASPFTRNESVDGIVFDPSGNPTAYQILKQHPGSGWNPEFDVVPAQYVVHWFRADRPGQIRGIPDITPALPLFSQLRRYTLAVLAAAETAADFAGILYTDAPASGEADAAEPFEPIELEKRALVTMPGGWKMSQLHAEQPTVQFGDFRREILAEIGRCTLVPVNVMTGDSSRHNYASGRLDHQAYQKSIRVDQSHLERVVLDRLLEAWLAEARLIPGYLGNTDQSRFQRAYFFDQSDHVDPAKEANAQATRLASLTTTLADEYARRGQDWETQLRQRAKEQALLRELGLTTPPPSNLPLEEPDDQPGRN